MVNSFYLHPAISEKLGEEMPLVIRFIQYNNCTSHGKLEKYLFLVRAQTLPSQR